jgi:hypothetical protein
MEFLVGTRVQQIPGVMLLYHIKLRVWDTTFSQFCSQSEYRNIKYYCLSWHNIIFQNPVALFYHSFLSLMQPKNRSQSLHYFKHAIKITFSCSVFQTYKAIFRQLFTRWNCCSAPVRMSVHPMLLHIVVRTKICLFENECSLFSPRYFHFAASISCPLHV